MTKELYSIGETARLFGISTQTLRFYDRKGILSPVYTDPETGYRYYSYMQFHIIDRIKYLQGFGLATSPMFASAMASFCILPELLSIRLRLEAFSSIFFSSADVAVRV